MFFLILFKTNNFSYPDTIYGEQFNKLYITGHLGVTKTTKHTGVIDLTEINFFTIEPISALF